MRKKYRKGVIALEAALAILLLVIVSYGVAATSALEFSIMSASKVAKQAEQYADAEASYLKMLGYYQVDDGIHGRQDMSSIIGVSGWQSKTEQVAEVKMDDSSSVKMILVSVWKDGDGNLPRFSYEVPLSSAADAGKIPIGGVITWGSDTLPEWFDADTWLECDGRSFDRSKYPKLAEVYTDGKVPNYSGLFLRGKGSQSVTQNNGTAVGSTSTTHTAGKVGAVQGDSTRRMSSAISGTINWSFGIEAGWSAFAKGSKTSAPFFILTPATSIYSMPAREVANSGNNTITANVDFPPGWYDNLTRWKYRLSGSPESGYDLIEETIPPSPVEYRGREAMQGFDTALSMPIANEIRPVNTAVRYFVRGK